MSNTTNDEVWVRMAEAVEITGWNRKTLLNWSKKCPKYFPHRIDPMSGRKEFPKSVLLRNINPKKKKHETND